MNYASGLNLDINDMEFGVKIDFYYKVFHLHQFIAEIDFANMINYIFFYLIF